MTNYYQLKLGPLKRRLPIIPISADTAIASFVLLGDDELSLTAADMLRPQLPAQFDYIVTVESKGIPFAHDLSLATRHPPFLRYLQIDQGLHARTARAGRANLQLKCNTK